MRQNLRNRSTFRFNPIGKCSWPEALAVAVVLVVAGCVAAEVATQPPAPRTVKIMAKRFDYTPSEITLKKGEPVDLELTSADRVHGFNVPGLGMHTEITPGKVTHLRFTPQKAGRFVMECDIFCGEGHEGMDGTIVVTE